MNRRDFLAASGALLAASRGPAREPEPAAPFVGIQIAGHSLFDEGIDHSLDLIRSTCRADALFLYSHSYYAAHGRPPSVFADHGKPIRDERRRSITRVWVRHGDGAFADTALKVLPPGDHEEYADRDPFAELAGPLRERGMKLYARILEPGMPQMAGRVANVDRVASRDLDGRPTEQPCRNHPDWKAFWVGLLADVARNYPIDGYQWGAERVGPLSELLWKGKRPFCFCEHCGARAKREGIDADRAKRGFGELHELITAVRGGARPAEGVLRLVTRALYRYPEILAWDYQWRLALEEQGRTTFEALKAVRKSLDVGRHLDHQNTSWDGLFAAQVGYDEMAPHCDFLKPILYHDILGPRVRWWHLERLKQGPLAELPLGVAYDLFLAARGYDPEAEPAFEELDRRGFSAGYVGTETRRVVRTVEGQCRVIAGIGIDVPDAIERPDGRGPVRAPSDPAGVASAVTAALDAGAAGVLVSREYDEMRVENLRAVGRAVADWRGR